MRDMAVSATFQDSFYAMGKISETIINYWNDSPQFTGVHFTTNGVYTVHPGEDRFLNIRELMHFMGLPHDFQIVNPKDWNYICQIVLLNIASAWAVEAVVVCGGQLEMNSFSSLKQDKPSQRTVEKQFTEMEQEVNMEQEDAGPVQVQAMGVHG